MASRLTEIDLDQEVFANPDRSVRISLARIALSLEHIEKILGGGFEVTDSGTRQVKEIIRSLRAGRDDVR